MISTATWLAISRNALGCAIALSSVGFACPAKPSTATEQVRINYGTPTDPAHLPVYQALKEAGALEYVQDVLKGIRLPRPLTIQLTECAGMSNAWYYDGKITVCYEYVAETFKNAAKEDLPERITQQDTVIGPLVDVFLHEAGHAILEYLNVPLFGREEDAADQFSAYVMLQYDKEIARRLIIGSAYQYRPDVQQTSVTLPISKFSDEHGHPAQRFFNILCLAYGKDPKLFSDLVTRKYLPEERSQQCEGEYEQVRFAFTKLIGPYVDRRAAKKALKTWHFSQ